MKRNDIALLLVLWMILFSGCQTLPVEEEEPAGFWFKGNTHAHTVICGHADTEPEAVAAWYHDEGYNFLVLSEHNHFINPDTVTLPANPRPDFILIPGEEVTGEQDIHTTALNIGGYVDPGPGGTEKTAIIQSHVDSTRARSGLPILNHPNFQSGAYAADIMPVQRLHMFELYNGHPLVYNWGEERRYHHVSTEAKWDSLLSNGMRIYGVASDDAHVFQTWAADRSNPGRGWVMVRSDTLTADAIAGAMAAGDFYASSGVILRNVDSGADHYSVAVDTAATNRELASPFLMGRRAEEGDPGYTIQFIGKGGKILAQSEETEARYQPKAGDGYVRAKVICRHPGKALLKEYFAWTQPVFEGEDF